MLFNFHYLTIAFNLAIWFGFPAAPLVILPLHYLFQVIYYAAGGVVLDSLNFWFLQALVTLCGTCLGVLFVFIYKLPYLMRFKRQYLPVWVAKFPFFIASLIVTQLIYANYAPPSTWTGLFFTIVLNAICVLLATISLLFNDVIFDDYQFINSMIICWIVTLIIMQASFYLVYTGLSELSVAFIAAAITFIFLIIIKNFQR